MRPFARSVLRGSLIAVCVLGSTSGLRAQAQANANANNNLKQLGLAMFNYSQEHRGLPPAAICDKEGKPLLSWRVAILPYLEQGGLQKQFKLDEPWDSPANKKLIERMPRVFDSFSDKTGETNYRVFFGGGALFDLKQKTPIRQITDGTSNTFLIVETAESVPWTAPQEIEYGAKKALPKLGVGRRAVVFGVAFADGAVRRLPTTLAETKLRAGITKAGGEIVNFDE
ncbi:MAG TPA: DUF1559 domain-containing protein [Gemmataceae bacterium]|jgi:hypothetical protein|nr:DUF1559 domain-containing protein [Gemmataceae bacterium]